MTTPIDQDLDGDGVPLCRDDCNDGNPFVYPDAQELCDGLDNDCDGLSDEYDLDGDTLPDCVDPDDDNDGALDVQDCAPLDATVWSLPEIEELFVTATGELVQLTWPPPMIPGGVMPPVYEPRECP